MILSEAMFGEIFPAIIVAVVAVYSIIAASIRAKKIKQKAQGAKPPIEAAPADTPAEKTPDEQFDEIVKKMEQQREKSREIKHTKQKERAQKQADRYRYDTRNSVTSTDDTGHAQVVTESFPKEKAAESVHPHPAEKATAGKKVKVEKRPSDAGSLGDLHDEGCEEHGDLRFVLDEVQSADTDTDAATRELQRMIVWSELLDSPKYKKRH